MKRNLFKNANRILAGSLLVFSAFVATAQTAIELPKLAPPLPELPPTFWEQYGSVVLTVVIAVIVIAIIVTFLVLRPKPVATVAPEVEARRSLEEIRSRPADGAVLSRVSQILRRYFIAGFALPPGEYTTVEFSRLVNENTEIGEDLSDSLVNFLQRCDERKFSLDADINQFEATKQASQLVELAEQRLHREQPSTEKTV